MLWSKGTPAWSETESITSKHTGTDARGKIRLPCSDVTVSANDMQIHVCHSSHRQCCSGKELVDWLMKQNECLQSRSQAVGMWQVLVDEGILVHGKDYYEFFLESIFVWISITLTFGQHPKIKDMSCFGWVLLYSGIFLIYSDDLKSLRVRLSFSQKCLSSSKSGERACQSICFTISPHSVKCSVTAYAVRMGRSLPGRDHSNQDINASPSKEGDHSE